MADQGDRQRQAAVLIADVAGFSAIVETGEAEAVAAVRNLADQIIVPAAQQYAGQLVKTLGDGFLLEFPTAVQAVKAALLISKKTANRNALRTQPRLALRMGIHTGSVISAGDDLFGNCVNIAARLESLAGPGEICVSGTVQEQVRGRINAAFDDLGLQVIRNISDPVRIFRIAENLLPRLEAEGPAYEISVAVLPFASKSPESAAAASLAETLTEDITIGLSRFRDLRVISRTTALRFAASASETSVAAVELGVRYLVEGTVRQLPDKLRVNLSLADGCNGISLISEQYDWDDSAGFSQQDALARQITQVLAGQLQATAKRKSAELLARGGPLTSKELALQAKALILDTRETLNQCRELYRQACDSDPGNASAFAGLALTYLVEWMSGWGSSPETTLDMAFPLLRRAARIDPLDSVAQRRLAVMHLFKEEFSLAEEHFQRALALNPNDTDAMAFRGLSFIYQGKPEKALAELQEASACNPFHPTYFHWFNALALYMCREYLPGITEVNKAIGLFPGFPAPRRHLAACYGQLGDKKAAAQECGRILQLEPGFSVSRIRETLPFAREDDLEHYCEGLRRAGLPD
ncbi:adenylate/guanylate cyclase domain-containing protein [Leisingera daeponensis]|uniref:adenylate/guanylate cyclase domain-containing protein n=1 Tax=Leisingera daeponensis TaxID=405746 RepID=UPI001C969249|nr:adenylate/guanylate cyclase domain-containing protein [Leisingera daeponensis]MBY6055609.1 adenylate cyclase Cya3 [Leisingera daeponensis]